MSKVAKDRVVEYLCLAGSGTSLALAALCLANGIYLMSAAASLFVVVFFVGSRVLRDWRQW